MPQKVLERPEKPKSDAQMHTSACEHGNKDVMQAS